jgi:hypothetical protein
MNSKNKFRLMNLYCAVLFTLFLNIPYVQCKILFLIALILESSVTFDFWYKNFKPIKKEKI